MFGWASDLLWLIDKAWCWVNDSKERFLRSFVPHIPLWITPNGISISRILSAVLIACMLFRYEALRGWIVLIFVIAIIGDVFDGPIARERGIATPTGAVLDRISDKLLVCPMIVHLLWSYHPWLATIMVIVESLSFVILQDRTSEWLAKYKMAAEAIGILILLLFPSLVTWAFGAFVSSLVLGGMSFIGGMRSRAA